LSGISEHVPSPSNAAAVNGVWADAAPAVSTVLFSAAVVSAAVESGDEDGDVEAGDVGAADDGEGDAGADDADDVVPESVHAAPAMPSTAMPPIRKKARRSGRGRSNGDEVMPHIQHVIAADHPRTS
jgi:hypothetical protein